MHNFKGEVPMKKDEKLKTLFDRFDSNIINDIQTQLDEELSKSDKDFNPDKVAELTAVIAQIKGGTLTEERKLNNIGKITDAVMAEQKRSQITRICKVLSTVCACLVIVIGLNIYTMNTFGDDLFSAAIKAAQNGFSLDFSGNDNNTPPNEDNPVEALSTTTAADYEEDDAGTTVTAATPESPVTETDINEQPMTETSADEIYATTTCAPVNIDDSTTTAKETATYHSDTQTVPDDSTSTSTTPCYPDITDDEKLYDETEIEPTQAPNPTPVVMPTIAPQPTAVPMPTSAPYYMDNPFANGPLQNVITNDIVSTNRDYSDYNYDYSLNPGRSYVILNKPVITVDRKKSTSAVIKLLFVISRKTLTFNSFGRYFFKSSFDISTIVKLSFISEIISV